LHPPPQKINEDGRAGDGRHGADGQFRGRGHRSREGIRRQSIARQNARTKESSVELKKVTTGGGI